MSAHLPLFDVPVPATQAVPQPTDVRRIIRHSAGPFRLLRPRTEIEQADHRFDYHLLHGEEFVIIERRDSSLWREFDGGRREPLPPSVTHDTIADAIRFGFYVEVSG